MRRIALFVLILTCSVLWSSAEAVIRRVPQDYLTIDQAMNVSDPGDTVFVSPDTYDGAQLTVDSVTLMADTSSLVDTTYLGGVTLTGYDVVLEGFTITNGSRTNGGGVYVGNRATIRHNVIRGNTASNFGGGIYVLSSSAHIHDNVIRNNSALQGGGILIEASAQYGRTVIHDNIIDSNTATERGGGIYLFIGKAVIRDNYFEANRAMLGGGLYSRSDDTSVVSKNKFLFNRALQGGGIYSDAAGDTIYHNKIHDNYAMVDAAWGDSAAGGGMYFEGRFNYAVLHNNIILGNTSDSIGGGITFNLGRDHKLFHSLVAQNTAVYKGGGICTRFSNLQVTGCVIRGNTAPEGPQMFQWGTAAAMLGLAAEYSNVEGGWPGTGNVDLDPLFRDAAGGDYHLMSTDCGDPFNSPMIDAGDPSHIDEVLDCQHGLGTSHADIGAYGGGNAGVLVAADDGRERPTLPEVTTLEQNYPNPFNASTVIRYTLSAPGKVTLAVYNVIGQRVATLTEGVQQAGPHAIHWQADDMPSGLYLARLNVAGRAQNIKMLLLK
jgi:hypothetical protein